MGAIQPKDTNLDTFNNKYLTQTNNPLTRMTIKQKNNSSRLMENYKNTKLLKKISTTNQSTKENLTSYDKNT